MYCFDQVSIRKANGFNLINAEEFVRIPVAERVLMILDNKVQFLKDGDEVPVEDAIRSIKAAAANKKRAA